jgi:serine/threonine-protein kinase HipA
MFKPVNAIEVRIWGRKVGALALDPKLGFYAFEYDPKFARSRIELAPLKMPLSNAAEPFVFTDLAERSFKRLPAMLSDALPDDFGNNLIDAWMARHGIAKERVTALDRLAYMGKRGMGALEFRPARGSHSVSTTAIKLSKLIDSARAAVHGEIESDELAQSALNQIIQVGTSAGGARAKAAIAWNPKTNEIRAGQFDVNRGYEHWLLKFDGIGLDRGLGSTQDYGRIEYAYFLMARDAGINISDCRLLEENGRAHFMTRRFDRNGNIKHHIQTLCAMAHLDYQQQATHDYSQLFLTIEQLGLNFSAKEEAFRRMVFNVIAANCDDHTKNISFILREGSAWELAPAYDVTHSYNPKGEWAHQHQMAVNGKFNGITRVDLLAVADRFGIGTATGIIKRVNAIIGRWNEYAAQANLSQTKADSVSKDHRLTT